jgi:hypothetical protein
MTPRIRKLALVAHVATSVGWLGAVVTFLAMALIGLLSDDDQVVRGVYIIMEPLAWLILVPLAGASLLSGVVQALGTPWGLLRHYWVVFKFLIDLAATTVLLSYMRTFQLMASVAADTTTDLTIVRNPSPAVHGGAALLLLLAALTLSIYKPRGLTRYGWRKQLQPGARSRIQLPPAGRRRPHRR